MFFSKKTDGLENLKFKFDEEVKNEPQEKIPFKELLAIMLAQYSILLPIGIIASIIFGLLLFVIVKLMLIAS